ncbi:hypothetical protein HanIR_Chr05g0239021 [Helianthus annuus]|nr:hypothetical protein HanIR_Chr05g0239021 [Helianthus annuus]
MLPSQNRPTFYVDHNSYPSQQAHPPYNFSSVPTALTLLHTSSTNRSFLVTTASPLNQTAHLESTHSLTQSNTSLRLNFGSCFLAKTGF